MDTLAKIKEAISILNEIDEYNDSLPDKLSIVDNKIQDLLHLIEFKNLSTNQRYRVIKELHDVRTERRNIKNDMYLLRDYKTNINKLCEKKNRGFLLSIVNKIYKGCINAKYEYRIYSEEEINNLIGE